MIDKREIKYKAPKEWDNIPSLPDSILEGIRRSGSYEPTKEEKENAKNIIYHNSTNKFLEINPRKPVVEDGNRGLLDRAITTRERIAAAKEFKNCQESLYICVKECSVQVKFEVCSPARLNVSKGLVVADVRVRKKYVACRPYSDTTAEMLIAKEFFNKCFKPTTLAEFTGAKA